MTEDGKQKNLMVDGLPEATMQHESTGHSSRPAPHRPRLLPDSNGGYAPRNEEGEMMRTCAPAAARGSACARVEELSKDKPEALPVYTDTPTLDISLQNKESISQHIRNPKAIACPSPGPCSLEIPMPSVARNAATLEDKPGSPNNVRSGDAHETAQMREDGCFLAHICDPPTEDSTAAGVNCEETSLHYGNTRIHVATIEKSELAVCDSADSTLATSLSRTDDIPAPEVHFLVRPAVSDFYLSPEDSKPATGAAGKVNILAGNEVTRDATPDTSHYTPSAPYPPFSDDSVDSCQNAKTPTVCLSPGRAPIVETARTAEHIVDNESILCSKELVAMLSHQDKSILHEVVLPDCSNADLGDSTLLPESCADGNIPSNFTPSSSTRPTGNTDMEDNVKQNTRGGLVTTVLEMDASRPPDDSAIVAEAVSIVVHEGTRICIEKSDGETNRSDIQIIHEPTDATVAGTSHVSCPFTEQDLLTGQPSEESSNTSSSGVIVGLMASNIDIEMQPPLVSHAQADSAVQDPRAHPATEKNNDLVSRQSTDASYACPTPTFSDDAEHEDGASIILNNNCASGSATSASDTLAIVLPFNDSSPSARNEHKATSVLDHRSLSLNLSYDHEPTDIQASVASIAILASAGLGEESRLVSRSLSALESTRQPDSELVAASDIFSNASASTSDDSNARMPVQGSPRNCISAQPYFIDNLRDFDMPTLEEQIASSFEPSSLSAHTVLQYAVGMTSHSEKTDLVPARSPSPLFSGRSSPCDVAMPDSDTYVLELPAQTENEEIDGPATISLPRILVESLPDFRCSNTMGDKISLPSASVDICSETVNLAATGLAPSQASVHVEEHHQLIATQQDTTVNQIIDASREQSNPGSQKQVVSGSQGTLGLQATVTQGNAKSPAPPLDGSAEDKTQKEPLEIEVDGPPSPYLPPSSLPYSQTSGAAFLARGNTENEGFKGGRNGVRSSAERSECEEINFSLPARYAENFEECPLPPSSFPSSSQVPTSSPDRIFSSPPPEGHVSPLSSPALHAYVDDEEVDPDIEMQLDNTLPNTDDPTVSLGKRSWSETRIAESSGEDRVAKKADVRRSPSPSPPQPIRPTAASLKQQFKKLTRPFRSPVMKVEDILSGKEGIYASAHARPSPLWKIGPSTVQVEFKREDPKQEENITVLETCALSSNKHCTAKAAKQFRSPFSAPKDGSSGGSNFTLSGIKPTTTIQTLQAKLQKLKQAIKLKNEEDDEGEDRLEELVTTWRSVGREVAWLVWDTVKDLSPGEGLSTDRWDDGVKHKGGIKGIDRGWGWDGKEQTPTNSTTDEEDQPTQPHTLGTMLRCLGIDPDTLGWDEGEGDFIGDP